MSKTSTLRPSGIAENPRVDPVGYSESLLLQTLQALVSEQVGKAKPMSDLAHEAVSDSGFSINATISKLDEDRRIVFGYASVISKDGKPVTDSQGDVITADELEKAAYKFVLNSRRAGEMHETSEGIGKLIESVVLTKSKQEAMGILKMKEDAESWWIGMHIESDAVWKSIKSGKYSAFSIHGMGKRKAL